MQPLLLLLLLHVCRHAEAAPEPNSSKAANVCVHHHQLDVASGWWKLQPHCMPPAAAAADDGDGQPERSLAHACWCFDHQLSHMAEPSWATLACLHPDL